ncbi:MAG TPA: hypothetical protein VFA81_10625 [Burkholderiales bacterium]|nr:hypothetical protein [Burkholderiales bacterium]
MPSVSQAQHGFMEMSRTAAGRRKLKTHGKTPAPAKVADEYHKADTGKKVGKLAKRVKTYKY